MASCEVDVAPPKVTPPGIPTTDGVAEQIVPTGLPPVIAGLLRRFPWLWLLVALLALILGCVVLVLAVAGAPASILIPLATLVVALVLLALWLRHWSAILAKARRDSRRPPDRDSRRPAAQESGLRRQRAGQRCDAASRGRGQRSGSAVQAWVARVARAPPSEPPSGATPVSARLLRPGRMAVATFDAIDPKVTIPKRTISTVRIPPRIQADQLVEDFGEVMVYPVIDQPMYQPLKDISDELFLPNVNLIAQNSITLLETNQKFIEAYMVGLNHEFARELLWREYPTDQRGSYFRQFWDVAQRARHRDGSRPGRFARAALRHPRAAPLVKAVGLGEHDHREKPGDNEEELVLAIRGELLKKYPTAVIYAHRAGWERMTDGTIDPDQAARLVELLPPARS